MVELSGRWAGKPREERASERRDMLIAAGIELFGSDGYRNTGVRAVCRRACLTERYFYESFSNSEELLLACFKRVVHGVRAQVVSADQPGRHSDERARSMLRAYFGTLAANPVAARVFLVEVVGVNPTIDRAFVESLITLSSLMFDVFDVERIGAVARNPLLHRAVAGGLLHIALAWGDTGYEQPIGEVVEAALILSRLAVPSAADKISDLHPL